MKNKKVKDGFGGIVAACVLAIIFWGLWMLSSVDFKFFSILDYILLIIAMLCMVVIPFGGIIFFSCIQEDDDKE
jgi:hypothetical protein